MMRPSFVLLALLAPLLAMSARTPATAPDWEALDVPLRATLAPWRPQWSGLPTEARQRLLDNARRWQAMDARAQAAYRERARAFAELAPAERALRRGRYAAWQALSEAEREQVRAAAARYAALPEARRQALEAAYAALPADEQQGWWLGPETGRWFRDLQPLFAYVPPEERAATLALLRALPASARADLGVLARRLAPAARERLRRDLLATPPEQRQALLEARLAR